MKFLCYEGTMQTSCLRLMGKKLLVALTMEGKFAGEGLQSIDEDDDMLSAMARELVERNGIGETADSVLKPSTQNIRSCSQPLHVVTMLPHPSNCRAFCWILSLTPRTLWREPWIMRPSSSSDSDHNSCQRSGGACGKLSRNSRHYSASVDQNFA